MSKLNERDIIGILTSKLGISNNLDDVATIGKGIIFKTDMLVASTDIPPGFKPWQMARKSIVSCVSDLVSKGVKPHAAMVSLALPRNYCTRPHIEGLAKGFATASKEFRVKIVGGDTNEASEIIIDCSMIGFTDCKIPTRNGANPSDVVVVSGMFGLQPAGLAILMQNATSSKIFRNQAIESVLKPMPRIRFGLMLAKYFSSSIDSSDGLAISLYELASQSRVDINISNIPLAAGVDHFAKENNLNLNELIFHGGEEYEIVATIPKAKIEQAKLAAKRLGIALHIIGRIQKGNGNVLVNGRTLEKRGYTHFSRR